MKLLRCVIAAAAVACPAQGDTAAPRRPFCRYVAADDGGAMEVLFATYGKDGRRLKLYAAFHVADPAYYQDLQRRFERHDALLFELIAEPGLRPYPGMPEGDGGFLGMVQDGMGNGLGLQGQFDGLDYRQDNFVHADMTDVEWYEALQQSGSSELGELMKGGVPGADAGEQAPKVDLVDAFRSGRGTAEMRIMMARELTRPDKPAGEPTVIIHGRNERCLEVLAQQVGLGRRDLGVFYGAAHMEHMERRLVEDLGWRLLEEEWVTCWDCRYASFPPQEQGLKQKRWRAKRDLQKLQPLVDAWTAAHPGAAVTWAKVRAAQRGGALPGRADGVDPWGRSYVLLDERGRVAVVCAGSDGEVRTADDVRLDVDDDAAAATAAADEPDGAREAPQRAHAAAAGAGRARALADLTALQYAVDLWCARHPGEAPTWDAVRALHPHRNLPVRGVEDPWGAAYALRQARIGYVVRSAGPDGEFDTDDDL